MRISDWSSDVCSSDLITIPPVGGNTEFANQHAALDAMPSDLRARVEGLQAIHSARAGYAPSGMYGANDKDRSMDIRSDDEALEPQLNPFIREHPETGRPGLFCCAGERHGFYVHYDSQALPRLSAQLQ